MKQLRGFIYEQLTLSHNACLYIYIYTMYRYTCANILKTCFSLNRKKPTSQPPFTQSPPRPFGYFEIRRWLHCNRALHRGRSVGVRRGVLRRSREEVGDGDEFSAAEEVDEPNVAEDQPGEHGEQHGDILIAIITTIITIVIIPIIIVIIIFIVISYYCCSY